MKPKKIKINERKNKNGNEAMQQTARNKRKNPTKQTDKNKFFKHKAIRKKNATIEYRCTKNQKSNKRKKRSPRSPQDKSDEINDRGYLLFTRHPN